MHRGHIKTITQPNYDDNQHNLERGGGGGRKGSRIFLRADATIPLLIRTHMVGADIPMTGIAFQDGNKTAFFALVPEWIEIETDELLIQGGGDEFEGGHLFFPDYHDDEEDCQ